MSRKSLSKKLRFEVFKRDSFTCQYCGEKAPDVVLHVDHILAVAKGGADEILNLVTACVDCNAGKGARKLDDRSAVKRQQAQLEELQARREQLEMMLQWRDEAERERLDAVGAVAERIGQRAVFEPNEYGRHMIRRWIKRYGLDEVLAAADDAMDVHLDWVGDKPSDQSWELAFKKIPAHVRYRREAVDRPYLGRLSYVQGILRRRLDQPNLRLMESLEEWLRITSASQEDHEPILDIIEEAAKRADNIPHFGSLLSAAVTTYWTTKPIEDDEGDDGQD